MSDFWNELVQLALPLQKVEDLKELILSDTLPAFCHCWPNSTGSSAKIGCEQSFFCSEILGAFILTTVHFSVAFFFAFFPMDFRAKERLLAVYYMSCYQWLEREQSEGGYKRKLLNWVSCVWGRAQTHIVRMFVFAFPGTLNRKLRFNWFIAESWFYYNNTGNI